MLYRIGRLLQLIGLLLLPVGIAGNLVPDPDRQISLKTSLLISAAGVTVFYIGWRLQEAGKGG
jgi:hypothetical protein